MENENNKLSVVIPTYNEEGGIGKVLDDIKEALDNTKFKYELIVVDDGSTDKTSAIASEKKVILVKHPYNKGYGAAIKTGMKKAKGDLILIIDADGTYPAKKIPELLEHASDYDMVVGARLKKPIIPLHRRPGKFIISKLAEYLTGCEIPDLNSGLRVFKKEVGLRFFNLFPQGFSFTITITLACLMNNYSVKYVPIEYHSRIGTSKVSLVKEGLDFISLIIRTIAYFNPLKIFLPISLLLFLSAALIFFYGRLVLNKIYDATVTIIIVASLLSLFFGLLADIIVKKLE